MNEVESAIRHFKRVVGGLKYLDGKQDGPYIKDYIKSRDERNRRRLQACRTALGVLTEHAERQKTAQWLDDTGNLLEPIKVESALRSEIMKLEFRKTNNPKDISILDYTIIAALSKQLEMSLRQRGCVCE